MAKVDGYTKEDLVWEIESVLQMRGYKISPKAIRNFVKKVKKDKELI